MLMLPSGAQREGLRLKGELEVKGMRYPVGFGYPFSKSCNHAAVLVLIKLDPQTGAFGFEPRPHNAPRMDQAALKTGPPPIVL